MSVLKVKVVNSETGQEFYKELIGTALREYEVSGEEDCIEFNAQDASHILVVAQEETDANIAVSELVDSFTADECDNLATDALPDGVFMSIIESSTASIEAFMQETTQPILPTQVLGIGISRSGGVSHQKIAPIFIP